MAVRPPSGRDREADAESAGGSARRVRWAHRPGHRLLAAYLAATGLLALSTLSRTGVLLAGIHAAGAMGAWAGSRRPDTAATTPAGRAATFLRVFLPVVITPVLYTELETINQLVSPGYLDAPVQAWEAALFGGQPSIGAARRFTQIWLSETLHLGYFSYYFVVPGAAIAVYRRGGPEALGRLTVTVALGFFLCYLSFAVFPVAGPRYEFTRIGGPPSEGWTFGLVHRVLEAGSSKGTAFPSSHVAAATAALLACRRDARRWFWIFLLPVAALTMGTVYGRFHYGVDAVAGVVVAVAAYAATPWLVARLGGTVGPDPDPPPGPAGQP